MSRAGNRGPSLGAMPCGPEGFVLSLGLPDANLFTWALGGKDGVGSVVPLGRRLWARAPWGWVRVEEVDHRVKSVLCARHCLNSFNPHSNTLSWVLMLPPFTDQEIEAQMC